MFIDKYYGDYGYYATRYPEEYAFATTCSFEDAISSVKDEYCPSWAKEILSDRIKNEFKGEKERLELEERKKANDKRSFLNAHPNADICIVNLASIIYGENDKKMMCDKITLDTALDEAFELYKRYFD